MISTTTPFRRGIRWSSEEEESMIADVINGVNVTDIAQRLGRTTYAIEVRISTIAAKELFDRCIKKNGSIYEPPEPSILHDIIEKYHIPITLIRKQLHNKNIIVPWISSLIDAVDTPASVDMNQNGDNLQWTLIITQLEHIISKQCDIESRLTAIEDKQNKILTSLTNTK